MPQSHASLPFYAPSFNPCLSHVSDTNRNPPKRLKQNELTVPQFSKSRTSGRRPAAMLQTGSPLYRGPGEEAARKPAPKSDDRTL